VLVLVALFIALHYKQIVFLTFNEELSRIQGIPIERINTLLAILTACTVIVTIRAVGILLVSALLVLPALSALQLSRSFRHTLLLAMCISLLSVLAGTLVAFSLNIPVGGAIVLLLVLVFAGTLGYGRIVRGRAQ
jgi:zinc transport system permease protein